MCQLWSVLWLLLGIEHMSLLIAKYVVFSIIFVLVLACLIFLLVLLLLCEHSQYNSCLQSNSKLP